MKKIYFSLSFVFFFLIAKSQNYKITYRHCVQIDTTRILTDTIGIEAVLIGNNLSSNYSFLKNSASLQKDIADTEAKMNLNTLDKIITEKKAGSGAFKVGTSVDEIGNMVFWNKESDSVFVREKMMNHYVVTREKKPEIKWAITEEIRKIQNYTCLKATTQYRGRNYTAWFTPDLPIAEGPWKFKGLPGLLLSISDDEEQVKIYATKVEFPTKELIPPFIPKGKAVTVSEYFSFLNSEMNVQIKNIETIVSNQQGLQESNQSAINPKMKKRMYYRIEKRF